MCRRLKVIDYISKFTEDKTKLSESNNIYEMDVELSETVKLWREDYMKMLLELYDPKYKYDEAKAVTIASGKYADSNNDIKTFVTEFFEKTDKKEDYILMKNIKLMYKEINPLLYRVQILISFIKINNKITIILINV